MKPKRWLAWGVVALTILAGCVPSLNPVYRPEDLVFDSSVVGTWVQTGEKARWEFLQSGDKSYRLLYTDNEGRQGKFIAHLANIEGQLFLDLFPEETEMSANSFYQFHLVPIHTIYLVRQTKPGLELAAIDYKWLEEELGRQPATIQSSTFNGRKLITAPTDEVRAFVAKNKEKFSGRFELQRAAQEN